ncbi:MAG: LysR family transcriptional regulator [Myxococcota bacterium]
MDWNDVRYFLALARLKSIRAAGHSLGVSHSTVARRVEALEEQLSARLFDRSRDGYTLTAAGREMLPGAERIEQEMSALERGVMGQDERLSGSVALTCCDHYVSALLMPALKQFCQEYPAIELRFSVDSRSFDLAKREADVAIRTLPRQASPPEFLIGQSLAPVTVANYVAREHAARLDPEQPGADPRWISYADRSAHELIVSGSSYPDLPSWGGFSSLELMVQAAREGLGMAILPTYVGDRDLALCRATRADPRHAADLWLLCHPDLRDNARLRATRARVAEALGEHMALFQGQWCAVAPG